MEDKNKAKKVDQGSGLIFAVVLLFVILGMVITLSSITVLETKMNQKTKSSVGAFYNSESGVEWALNQISIKDGTAQISTIGACPFTGCSVLFLDKDGKVLASSATIDQVKAVRSIGNQGGETQRTIEAAVASGGGSCFVSYANGCVLGFQDKGEIGSWGLCLGIYDNAPLMAFNYFNPPGGTCYTGPLEHSYEKYGTAHVCCEGVGGSSGCYVSHAPPPGSADATGKCLANFTNKGLIGSWGMCVVNQGTGFYSYSPPGGVCPNPTEAGRSTTYHNLGEGYLCCL